MHINEQKKLVCPIMNRAHSYQQDNVEVIKCLADGCAAWEFSMIQNPDWNPAEREKRQDADFANVAVLGPRYIKSTTDGYCRALEQA